MSQTDKKDKIKKALERVKLSDFALEGFDKELYQKERLCKLDESFMNKKVSVFGWVTASRAGAKFSFLDLTSQFKTIKCIVPTSTSITMQTSLRVYGSVVENKGTDDYKFELSVDAYEVFNGYQAPPFPINKDSEKETWRIL